VSSDTGHRLTRGLGFVALALALLAPFGGSPYAGRHATIDVASLAVTVAREEDHVSALELAQWIKDRRAGLRIVDVRSAAEYAAYHVPRAEHVALDSLANVTFREDDTIVLYSEGGAHAAQAWVFLRALGYKHVFFLRGGVYEWLDQVMNPRLSDTTPAGRNAFARAGTLSRYFGGVPRSDLHDPRDLDAIRIPAADSLRQSALPLPSKSTEARILEVRRRGC
jgi:rhodanese-related sulfurtransferase